MGPYHCPQCGMGWRDSETISEDKKTRTIFYTCGGKMILVRNKWSGWNIQWGGVCRDLFEQLKKRKRHTE